MILDEDGSPFDHRDHCEVVAHSTTCQSHLREFSGHTEDEKPVCDWFAGMWVHDCCNRKRLVTA